MGSSTLSANAIIIITVIILVVIIALIRYVINSTVDKASDAIRNKKIQKQEKINPPKQEKLSDRFNGTDWKNK